MSKKIDIKNKDYDSNSVAGVPTKHCASAT